MNQSMVYLNDTILRYNLRARGVGTEIYPRGLFFPTLSIEIYRCLRKLGIQKIDPRSMYDL